MDQETKSNIKIGVIALLIMGTIFFSLYKYNVAHEASHSAGDHSH